MAKKLALATSLLLGVSLLSALGAVSGGESAAAPTEVGKPLWEDARNYYSTLVAPAVEPPVDPGRNVDERRGADADRLSSSQELQRRHSTGFPPAAAELARREAEAKTAGTSPRANLRRSGADDVTRARLLTILVEFNPEANDDFSGWERPNSALQPTGCVTEPAGTLLNGPVHNQIPDPATKGTGRDNYTFWVPDFSPRHYDKLIYSRTGLTQRVRTDLGRGVDLRGRTVRNHFAEMSDGRYLITGGVTPWITLPHSGAWYSADSCRAGRASDIGHPDNPRGTGQMVVDAVDALHASDPDFPFADYDVEDQADHDGDGNLFEPDGVLDHVVVIHAGVGQSSGGGEQEGYAEWASSQVVDPATGGYEIADTGYKVFNYTTQPENAGVGVISHEYGHDLGLPDLYDSVGPTDTDVAWWDLMSTGSHSGELFQMLPTHMGAWSKYVLGWIEPEVLPYGSRPTKEVLGQAVDVPRGTEAAVKVELPTKEVSLGAPHSGENAWWSNQDQNDADVRVGRQVEVPSGGDVRFWMWNDYTIERLWDYGFVEVSADGGTTWTQLEVTSEDGTVVSTDEDPNNRLDAYFGGLENGLTGDSGGYRHDSVDLTPYAGSTVQVRLRYATDAAFTERGWFADDFSLTVDGTEVWADDLESEAEGWTAEVESWTGTAGAGWTLTDGSFDFEQYYLVEWRTPRGFDEGLHWGYTTRFSVDGELSVDRLRYNAPGMLVWHRDMAHTFNDLTNNLFDAPSIGAKGQLLLVDSHYEPSRLSGEAADLVSGLDNLNSRAQAADVAFGPVGRYPFTFCVPSSADDPYAVACNRFGTRKPVTRFTDAVTWYPGVEYRPDIDPANPLFFRDNDASTVVPSEANEIYSTRIVDAQGRLLEELFGLDLGGGHVTGTGNPADGRPATATAPATAPGTEEDLSLGVEIRWLRSHDWSRKAEVWIKPGHGS